MLDLAVGTYYSQFMTYQKALKCLHNCPDEKKKVFQFLKMKLRCIFGRKSLVLFFLSFIRLRLKATTGYCGGTLFWLLFEKKPVRIENGLMDILTFLWFPLILQGEFWA